MVHRCQICGEDVFAYLHECAFEIKFIIYIAAYLQLNRTFASRCVCVESGYLKKTIAILLYSHQ